MSEISNSPDTTSTLKTLKEQIKQRDVQIFTLTEQIEEIDEELKTCKEFFGYNGEMTLQEMKQYKEECEEDEQKSRETDPEYAEQCEKMEELSDLVVELGEYQYSLSQIHSKMKKLSSEQLNGIRKIFASDFNILKNMIQEEDINKFFNLLHEWLDIQKMIHIVDKKIANIKE